MMDLIERKAALYALCEDCKSKYDGLCPHEASKCIEYRAINRLPAIEAEPVRHGRMIEGRYPNENKCSECSQEFRDDIGFIIQDDDGVFHYPKRCPECGCFWDGGADNDD